MWAQSEESRCSAAAEATPTEAFFAVDYRLYKNGVDNFFLKKSPHSDS